MRARRVAGVGLVAGFVVVGAWACDAGEIVADAMVDAAGVLRDASSDDASASVLDGAGPEDATRPPAAPVNVSCNVERTQRVEYAASGYFSETTFWYAELRDPSIDPSSDLPRVEMCDREIFGANPDTCAAPGWSCIGVAPAAPPLRCQVSAGGEIEAGVFRVFCGNRATSRANADAPTTVYGSRWTSVRVTID